MRGYQGYERVLKEFDATIGLDKLKAIHLNDSKTELGSKVDRHAPIGEGKMGLQVFHAFVRDQRFRDAPMILELPSRDADLIKQQLELLRKLQATTSPVSEPEEIREQSTLDSTFRT
jgi:deoxyribonuclease-4